MRGNWNKVKGNIAHIVEWWHDPGTAPYRAAMHFARASWLRLESSKFSDFGVDEADLKLWVLTITYIWRGYLIDFGAQCPCEVDGWPEIGEWIEFDVYAHFDTQDSHQCRSALQEELRKRTGLALREIGTESLREFLPQDTMAQFTSIDNMIAIFLRK